MTCEGAGQSRGSRTLPADPAVNFISLQQVLKTFTKNCVMNIERQIKREFGDFKLQEVFVQPVKKLTLVHSL